MLAFKCFVKARGTVDYSLSPPSNLKEGALIAAAIGLFTQRPVKDEILRVFEYRSQNEFDKRWKKIIVKERIEALELPQTLKAKLVGISTQIGLEILEWAKYYGQYYCESAFFNNMRWTQQGSIDAERTARKLVNDQSLSILKRYKIACINCFDDMITDLWKQLGKNEEHLDKIKKSRRYDSLAVFWSYKMYGRSNEIIDGNSENEYGLKVAIDHGNSVAARYFWEKLTPLEKEKNLEECIVAVARESYDYMHGSTNFPNSCYTNIFCFLLNQMNEEQQSSIFNDPSTAGNVLNGLLNFPYQQFFIQTAEQIWHSLQEREYYSLLYHIEDKISNYPQGYMGLMQYVWHKIPDKEKAINTLQCKKLLLRLFDIEGYGNIRLILDSVSVSVREKYILSYKGKAICHGLIRQNKWNGLEFFIRSCLRDKDAALKFKETEKISHRLLENELQDKAGKFTKLLNDLIASFDVEPPVQKREKRKIEDDDIPTKKIKTGLEIMQVNSLLGKVC